MAVGRSGTMCQRAGDSLGIKIDMENATYILAILAMAAVAIVLIRGLFNMMKGGDANRSNKLMQMRVLLQFIAIVLIVLTLWLTGGGR